MNRFDQRGLGGPSSSGLAFGFLVVAATLSGCVAGPTAVSTPAADLGMVRSSSGSDATILTTDSTTRKTNELLAAVGANKLDGLKPMKMDAMGPGMRGDMGGMDHSQMPGMQAPPPKMQGGMDHSNMPGMAPPPAKPVDPTPMENMPGMNPQPNAPRAGGKPASPSAPPTAAATAKEMKKTAAEMKKASEALKAKAEAMKRRSGPTPKDGKP